MKAKYIWLVCVMLAVISGAREASPQTAGTPETSSGQEPPPSAAMEAPVPVTIGPSSRYTFPVLAPMLPAPGLVPGMPSRALEGRLFVSQRPDVGVEELLPVPVYPGDLLMPDHGENPTLGFGYGLPLAGLASAGTRGILAPGGDVPTWGPVVLLRTGVRVNVDVLYDTGFQDGLSPAGIALRGTGASRQAGQFNLQSSSAVLSSDVQLPGTSFPLQGYFEGELGPDGLAVRQVFGRVGNLLGGKNWTSFGDADMLPRTIVDTRAPAGAIYRPTVAQLQYMVAFDSGWALGTAIEQPVNDDFDLNDPNQPNADNVRLHRYPDLVSRVRFLHPDRWGMTQVAVLVRAEGYEDTGYQEHFVTGWGVSGNSRFKTWGDDNVRVGVAGGQGFGSYLFGLDTAQSAVFDSGRLRPLPCFGSYIGYQHLWAPHLWSNFAYGYGQTSAIQGRFVDAPRRVHNGWIDLVWSVNKNCAAAIEYSYGVKEAWDGRTGDNHQILFSLQIGTQAAPSASPESTAGADAAAPLGSAPARAPEESGNIVPAPALQTPMSRPGYSLRM